MSTPRLFRLAALWAAITPLCAQTLDLTFAPAASADVFALAAQPDGKLLVGGSFTTLAGVARPRLARLNANGSVDTDFNPSPGSGVNELVLQPDGKILAAGDFTTIAGTTAVRVARLNADGTRDNTFTGGTDATVLALGLQPDGKVLVGGLFAFVNNVARTLVARLNPDGSLDPTFNPVVTGTVAGSQSRVDAFAVQADGKILFAGNFAQVNGVARPGLVRVNADGTLDPTFTPGVGPNSGVQAIVLQADGKIVIGGSFTTFANLPRRGIARLSQAGVPDEVGLTGPSGPVNALVLQPNGAIVAAGSFNAVGSLARSRLARFGADGVFDSAFDPDVTGAIGLSTPGIYAMISPGPDQLVIGGTFAAVSGQPRSGLARLGTPLPVITRQPADLAATPGAQVTLSVATTATANLTYQWRRNGNPIASATTSSLALPNVQSADAGTYTVVVTNPFGSTPSAAATLTVGSPTNATTLALVSAPQSQHASAGARATLTAQASGSALAYQWKKDGIVLPSATAANLVIPITTAADMGYYTVVVSSGGSAIESPAAILTVATPGVEGRLINVSTRGFVPPGGSLTPGFVLAGTGTKRLLVRAAGPTLARFGLTAPLADPRLELVPLGSSTALATNDDWTPATPLATATTAVGAFALDAASKDSALLVDLATAGAAFTARVTTPGDASGLALAEVYDTDPLGAPARLVNVSTRGFVGTGANALVPGFVIGGAGPKRLLIRAVGPGLAPFGVNELLLDPQLAVIPLGKSAPVAANDNWGGTAELITAFASVGAFGLPSASSDAAVLVWLPPGAYTVTVSGVGATTGTALVEIYDAP
ncbi:MAG: immunoglobulin domain-containing protein [Opitutaceae bacterium]|nr:immunoglobulin domain-containing protein [Opitutaceae bacterium]